MVPTKKICLLLTVIATLSALVGCAGEGKRNEPMELPEFAFIDRMFSAEGTVYAIRSAGGYSYITAEGSPAPVCYQLAALSNGRYSDAVWNESSGRLYYSDGCGVYCCDLTGNEKSIIWELPKGTKKDFVNIAASANDYLLVKGGYGERQSASRPEDYMYKTCGYYSLNIKTGEAIPVLNEVPFYKLPVVLCAYENTVIAVQLTSRDEYDPILVNKTQGEETARVLRMDLQTGESKELGSFCAIGTISAADGAVCDDRLYFICEKSGLYSMPLSGGEIERLQLDTARVPGMDQYISMEESKGAVYLLMWDGVTYPPSALCIWDPETGLLPVTTTDNTFSATGFLIDRETYFLFAGAEIISGKLPEHSS